MKNERRWGLRSERSAALLGLIATLGCGPSSPAPVAPASAPTVPESAPFAPPDVDGECAHEREKDRELIPAPCSGACTSFRIVPRRCENGRWRKLAPIEPKCACAPESVPASLRECQARTILLTPSDEGASDGVTMKLTCGNTLLDVECDGENDGTGTSLCSCYRDGKERRIAGDPWPGEGISVAYRVAERCLSAK